MCVVVVRSALRCYMRALVAGVVALTMAVAVLSAAGTARAAQSDFCGVLKASNAWCGGYISTSWSTWWTWTSNRYLGGGTIDQLDACMSYNGVLFSKCWSALRGTYAYGCWYKNYIGTGDYGLIRQFENSGASHTIYGHNDDSPNHSNCIPAFDF